MRYDLGDQYDIGNSQREDEGSTRSFSAYRLITPRGRSKISISGSAPSDPFNNYVNRA